MKVILKSGEVILDVSIVQPYEITSMFKLVLNDGTTTTVETENIRYIL